MADFSGDTSFDASLLFNTPTRIKSGSAAMQSIGRPTQSSLSSHEPANQKNVHFSHTTLDRAQQLPTSRHVSGGPIHGSLSHWGLALKGSGPGHVGAPLVGSNAHTPIRQVMNPRTASSSSAPLATRPSTNHFYPSFSTSSNHVSTPPSSGRGGRDPSTPPAKTKSSALVPISLSGGSTAMGTARMAQRLRVNVATLVASWFIVRTRPYNYITGAAVQALPVLDTPLYIFEWVVCLVLLTNISEALFKLVHPAPPSTHVALPLSPQERVSGSSNGELGRSPNLLKQSPRTRTSISSTAHTPRPSLSQQTNLSPLNLASPLPKSRSTTALDSPPPRSNSPHDLLRRSLVHRGSPLKYSALTNVDVDQNVENYKARHGGTSIGIGTPGSIRGARHLSWSLGSSGRRVSDSQAVESLVNELF